MEEVFSLGANKIEQKKIKSSRDAACLAHLLLLTISYWGKWKYPDWHGFIFAYPSVEHIRFRIAGCDQGNLGAIRFCWNAVGNRRNVTSVL
jgi:hypothetical protein